MNYIEHVQSVISIQSSSRGSLAIYLTSPYGTTSTLLDFREHDKSSESFDEWPFTTVHMWGETCSGKWTLKIENQAENSICFYIILFKKFSVIIGCRMNRYIFLFQTVLEIKFKFYQKFFV